MTSKATGQTAVKKPNLLDSDDSDDDTFKPATKQTLVSKNQPAAAGKKLALLDSDDSDTTNKKQPPSKVQQPPAKK